MPKKKQKKQEYKSNFVAILRRLKGCCSFTSTLNYNNNSRQQQQQELETVIRAEALAENFPKSSVEIKLERKMLQESYKSHDKRQTP